MPELIKCILNAKKKKSIYQMPKWDEINNPICNCDHSYI